MLASRGFDPVKFHADYNLDTGVVTLRAKEGG